MWVLSKDKILSVEAKTVKTKYRALGLSKDSFMVIWFTTLDNRVVNQFTIQLS